MRNRIIAAIAGLSALLALPQAAGANELNEDFGYYNRPTYIYGVGAYPAHWPYGSYRPFPHYAPPEARAFIPAAAPSGPMAVRRAGR
jgi:hypothetical protein